MHLALIGYRGTGKSTIGPLIAKLHGAPVIDADLEIEQRAGKSIREIFSVQGESYFRDLETRLLRELLAGPTAVLSLGGGIVLREENCQLLKSCFTVWLQASLETLVARLATDPTTHQRRPSLTGLPTEKEIAALLEARAPLYAACADFTLCTDQMTAHEAAKVIEQQWLARDASAQKR